MKVLTAAFFLSLMTAANAMAADTPATSDAQTFAKRLSRLTDKLFCYCPDTTGAQRTGTLALYRGIEGNGSISYRLTCAIPQFNYGTGAFVGGPLDITCDTNFIILPR